MPNFPTLKTGAVMQYPAKATTRYFTQVLQFVDGTEQRYREYRAPIHEWVIALDLLDEEEMDALDEFFTSQQGQFENFVFVDPKDDTTYPDCSLMIDDVTFTL